VEKAVVGHQFSVATKKYEIGSEDDIENCTRWVASRLLGSDTTRKCDNLSPGQKVQS
jgi:hypothetical protein